MLKASFIGLKKLRTTKVIPNNIVSIIRSRSLTESTRQTTPRTKNGHAPPYKQSRKDFNLSILHPFGPGEVSRVVKLSRKFHSWWCSSVNSFKFLPCDYTPPRTQKLSVSFECWSNLEKRSYANPLSVWFTVRTTMVSNHFRSPNFRSSLTDM